MAGRQCYHCKQWIAEGDEHDCGSTHHSSKSKVANILRITHRDEVEPPLTDWLREAYEFSTTKKASRVRKPAAKTSKRR